ncbi:MAG: quinone-dependent dihydroorotate dehydrogenase [Burkholderiales bacterium]
MYSWLRPFLFKLDPETAHRVTLNALRRAHRSGLVPRFVSYFPSKPVCVMGLEFPNRIGLAAGLDKNGEYIDALAALGFGFLEVGTVTPRPQEGAPPPRLFRLPAATALINRLGFNNAGVDQVIANLKASSYRGILGINIGKNADTPIARAADDYCTCLEAVYPLASYVAINVSSPNTKDLRRLQGAAALAPLLSRLNHLRDKLANESGRKLPLAIKIAPDLEQKSLREIAGAALDHRIDAVIATNTTLSRESVTHLSGAMERGGLSGLPLRSRSTAVIRALANLLQGKIPIIGVGGIVRGADALEKIEAGASLIQLYTGLIYRGPDLISECASAITRIHNSGGKNGCAQRQTLSED